MLVWHLKQIGEVRKLDKYLPHKLTENLKKQKTNKKKLSF